jgi:general stress protein YciG
MVATRQDAASPAKLVATDWRGLPRLVGCQSRSARVKVDRRDLMNVKGVGIEMESTPRTKNRGFASMDAHRQREIARKGGRAAHEKGKAHEFTPDEARAAGRKGGEKVSVNRRHMAEIGRRGGRSSAQRRRPDAGGGSESGNGNGNGNAVGMQHETQQAQQEQSVGMSRDRHQERAQEQQNESNSGDAAQQAN